MISERDKSALDEITEMENQYVSILDLIANCGKDGINYHYPDSIY